MPGAGPVVLIDIDPQGSLTDWWNLRQSTTPLFARATAGRLAAGIDRIRELGVKLLIIDTPPAITGAIVDAIRPRRFRPRSGPAVAAGSARRRRHGRDRRAPGQADGLRRQRRDAPRQDHQRSAPGAGGARADRARGAAPPHQLRRQHDRRPHRDGDPRRRALGDGDHRSSGHMSPAASPLSRVAGNANSEARRSHAPRQAPPRSPPSTRWRGRAATPPPRTATSPRCSPNIQVRPASYPPPRNRSARRPRPRSPAPGPRSSRPPRARARARAGPRPAGATAPGPRARPGTSAWPAPSSPAFAGRHPRTTPRPARPKNGCERFQSRRSRSGSPL